MFLICLARVASAEPKADFKKELQAGIDAFRLGKYDEARTFLLRARTIDRKAGDPHRYLAALSQAEKMWDECMASAREALVVEPASKEVADTRKLHAACRTSAGLPPYTGEAELGEFAAIAVTSNVPATVKIRGLVFGGTPIAPRPIAPGRLAIDVEKGGYATAHLDLDVVPGIVTDVRVDLQPGEEAIAVPLARKSGHLILPARPTQLVVDGVAVQVPASNKVPLSPGIHLIEIREPGKDAWRRRVAIIAEQDRVITPELGELGELGDAGPRERRRKHGIAMTGGAAVILGLGVAAFYASSGASDDARQILAAEIGRPIGDATPPIRTRAEFDDARDRSNRWALISNVTYAAGLATLGVGIYWILKSRAPADDDVPELVIAPVQGGALIGRAGQW